MGTKLSQVTLSKLFCLSLTTTFGSSEGEQDAAPAAIINKCFLGEKALPQINLHYANYVRTQKLHLILIMCYKKRACSNKSCLSAVLAGGQAEPTARLYMCPPSLLTMNYLYTLQGHSLCLLVLRRWPPHTRLFCATECQPTNETQHCGLATRRKKYIRSY